MIWVEFGLGFAQMSLFLSLERGIFVSFMKVKKINSILHFLIGVSVKPFHRFYFNLVHVL